MTCPAALETGPRVSAVLRPISARAARRMLGPSFCKSPSRKSWTGTSNFHTVRSLHYPARRLRTTLPWPRSSRLPSSSLDLVGHLCFPGNRQPPTGSHSVRSFRSGENPTADRLRQVPHHYLSHRKLSSPHGSTPLRVLSSHKRIRLVFRPPGLTATVGNNRQLSRIPCDGPPEALETAQAPRIQRPIWVAISPRTRGRAVTTNTN